MSDPPLSLPAGLESDDSAEVSFKDALVFDSKKVTGGGGSSSTQENGVWERRYMARCCSMRGTLMTLCVFMHVTT